MKLAKKDFIELDFTARTGEGIVFNTTLKAEAEKAHLPEADYTPMKICIGEGQLLRGLDKELVGKEVGKEYEVTLPPEDAFGKRDSKLVRIIPLKIFHEKEVNPYPGLSVAIDNMIATVRAVSGGRVITDFNHPFAGRRIVYKFTVRKKLEKTEEKVGMVLDRYLRTDKFTIDGKEIILKEKVNEFLMKEAEKKVKELIGELSIRVVKVADENEGEKAGEKEVGEEGENEGASKALKSKSSEKPAQEKKV